MRALVTVGVGAVLTVAGVAVVYWPAGLIVAGLGLLTFGALYDFGDFEQ